MLKKILSVTTALIIAVAMAGITGMDLPGAAHQALAKDKISKDEAGKIATDKYGGDIINVEEEHEDGKLVYEVEIKNSKQGRIEVDVDAHSGEIVGMEKEDEDDGDNNDSNGDNNNETRQISKDDAAKIVTDKYGGDVISVKKKHENGKLVYEVELKNSKQGRIEVDVDAASGKIVHVEKEDKDKKNNNDEGQNATGTNQNGGNGGSGTGNQEGGQLAQTASDYPLLVLGGILIVIAGGALLIYRKRTHTSQE